MRKFEDENAINLVELRCNCCGRVMKVENGIIMEGCFHVDYPWGYFSKKDGIMHSFDLCEECYDKWIDGLTIKPTKMETKEFL